MWRGEQSGYANRAGNQAVGYDRAARHLGKTGEEIMAQGTSSLAQGLGTVGAPGSSGWEPTVLYLFVLVLVEMFVFGLLAKLLR